jgi:hypothetical protein
MMKICKKPMVSFFKKARYLLALPLAVSTWQASIPVVLVLVSSAFVTAEIARAVESMPVTLVQGFGYDPTYAAYKVLIQSRSGNQYFVWYDSLIEAKIGSVIVLTYEGSGRSLYFYKLINTGNGKEARISRYQKVN